MATPKVGILISLNGVQAALAGLGQIERGIDRISDRAIRAGQGLSKFGAAMQRAGIGITAAITVPVIAAGTALFRMAADAQETENLFRVAMGGMADEADSFARGLNQSLGLVQTDLRKMLGTTQQIITSMGIADEKAFEFSKTVTLLANDIASFFNIGTQEAFQKLISGLTGEAEPLKRLGIIVTDVRLKQEALAMGIDTATSEMTEQQKVLLRLRAILSQTENAQGDLARTLNSPTNQMRILTGQIREQGIELGTALLPAFNTITGVVRTFLNTAVIPAIDWFNSLQQSTQNTIVVVALLAAAIGPVTVIIGTVINLIGRLVIVLGALGKALAFIARNPIILVIGAIVALVANLEKVMAFVRQTGEVFRNVWGLIKTTVLLVIEQLRGAFLRFVTFIVDRLNALTGFFDKAEARLRDLEERSSRRIKNLVTQQTGLFSNLSTQINSVFSNIREGFTGLVNLAGGAADAVTDSFASLTDNVQATSESLFEEQKAQFQSTLATIDELFAQLETKRAAAADKIKVAADEAKDKTIATLGSVQIKSSTVLDTLESAFTGFFQGIVTGGLTLKDALSRIFEDIANAILRELARVVAAQVFKLIFGFITGGAGFAAGGGSFVGAPLSPVGTTFAQTGGSFTVTKPTAFIAGEVGPERVNVRRLTDSGRGGTMEGLTIVLSPGTVVDEIGFDRFIDRVFNAVKNRARDEI